MSTRPPHEAAEQFNKYCKDSFILIENPYSPGGFIPLDYSRTAIDAGWVDLVIEAFDELIKVGWNRQLSQVKQKFGMLRIYLASQGGRDMTDMRGVIEKYETKSASVCEKCGTHGASRDTGDTTSTPWIITSCKSCQQEMKARRRGR